MRELKDVHTSWSDGAVDPVLLGIAHGLKQLALPSPNTMPEELQSLLRRVCATCEAAHTEADAEMA